MLSEIFRSLRPFQSVEEYSYVGLGSVWFSDFILFHRALGVKRMLSIEREVTAKSRIDANIPFKAVEVDYRESAKVLPELDWTNRSFVWLDYDDPLVPGMLLDAGTVAARARSGSVLAISVQCQKAKQIDESTADPDGPPAFSRFLNAFGKEAIPPEASEEDLLGWPFARLTEKMIRYRIEASLAVRNLGAQPDSVMTFRPICQINYEDGAKMATMVGIFAEVKDYHLIDSCGFDQLDFMPATGCVIKIEVPILTVREIRHLERQLPQNITALDLGAIPQKDARHFAELYRYFPNFAVLES